MAEAADGLIKELYARFGLAYFEAECLHRGLCNVYMVAPFAVPDGITGPRVDERMSEAFAMTLGQVVEALAPWTPGPLLETLKQAVERRNYLAHRFWFERCHLTISEDGVHQLLDELAKDIELFGRCDAEVGAHFSDQAEQLGVTNDLLHTAIIEMVENPEDRQAPTTQRRLRKQETIIRIWDAPIESGAVAQIFELDDGSLWQLSDVGLGWTRFARPNADWRENALLKRYLPARTNPRPGAPGSWNYELALGSLATISVRLSRKHAKTYVWSLRTGGDSSGA